MRRRPVAAVPRWRRRMQPPAPGCCCRRDTRRIRRELKPRDGFLLVTLGWLLLSASAAHAAAAGAAGAVASRDAFFEAMSGLTTTGSTVLDRARSTCRRRSTSGAHSLHWFGGLGDHRHGARRAAAAGRGRHAALQGRGAGPGQGREARAAHHRDRQARCGSSTRCSPSSASWRCGSAACPGSTPSATPSRRSASAASPPTTPSVAYFNSPAIELVLMALMLVASLNFARHFDGAAAAVAASPTSRTRKCSAILVVLAAERAWASRCCSPWHGVYRDFMQSLRHAAFNVVSHGHHQRASPRQDYQSWPVFAPYLDAVPVVHRLQHRLDRRRHQDVPRAAAGAPGGPRAQAARAPRAPWRRCASAGGRCPTASASRCWPSSSCTS